MERIASFCVDHTRLDRGMYLSRQDGDVLTWDIRMKKPNQGDYLTTGAAHTLEHLFATYARNSAVKDGVVYVGPMGCRTGFYLLTRGLTPAQALQLTVESFRFMAAFEGASPRGQRGGVRQLPRYGPARRQGRSRCHASRAGKADRRPAALLISSLHRAPCSGRSRGLCFYCAYKKRPEGRKPRGALGFYGFVRPFLTWWSRPSSGRSRSASSRCPQW